MSTPESAVAARQLRPGRARRRKAVAPYLFLLPFLLGMVFITLGPMLASLYLSFTNYDLIGTFEWVGLDNYERMLTSDRRFMNSVGVTFRYVFISVPLQLVLALGLAMALDRGLRGLPIYRSIYYLPSLLGASVAVAVLWRQVFGSSGLFNQLLGLVGIDVSTSWVTSPSSALGTLIVLNVWTFGSPMIIFLAGLRQIPRDMYEAARVDGATPFKEFIRITIPLLTPIIFFNMVLQFIGSFQAFAPAYIVSGGTGGPADSTLFYTLYLYQQGFANFNMGYAAGMAWLLLLVVAAFTGANFFLGKHWVHYESGAK